MDKEDAVYIHSEMLAIKNNEITPFVATQMDLEIIIPSEVSQKEKGKYYMKSKTHINLSTKHKQTHREQTYGCQGVGWVVEERSGSLGLSDANYLYRMNGQQGPTV